ncbi:MAG: hypothetical protein U9Q15_04960 [Patescibacteria group bacterium]|nr:hypothetical protein [Patescibacteria group bacterium]
MESIPLTQSAILSRDPETTPHDTIQTYVYKIEHVARIDAAYAPGQYSAESSYQVTPKY